MKFNKFFVLIIITLVANSCKNYYNETIKWADNLETELNIKDVKKQQPDFIEIDWENPRTIDNQKLYLITKIKGNRDILGMSHYLVFIENKYQYRESKK